MDNKNEREFQELLQDAIDGALSADQARRLQELAGDDDERLEQLVDHVLIASLLVEEGGTESVAALVDVVVEADGGTSRKKTRGVSEGKVSPSLTPRVTLSNAMMALTAAAVIAVIVSASLWRDQASPDTPSRELAIVEHVDDSVALLRESADVRWEGEAQPSPGATLVPGVLRLAEGIAQLEFYSGAQLIVEGPAELELESAYRVRCRSGRIRARVPQQARGFTVMTPKFDLVDLGTEFGMDVSATGEARVKVFDGEVEIHRQDKKESVLGGQSVAIDKVGALSAVDKPTATYPSFDELKTRASDHALAKLERWRRWNESLRDDSRIVEHFDFESASSDHNTVVGCSQAEGRWPGKNALEFRRASDRVRVDVDGEFEALTLSAWIRLDALPGRHQGILLTDEFKLDRVHWQITSLGELSFAAASKQNERKPNAWQDSLSPVVFGPRQLGVWSHICTTFDMESGHMRHFVNGRQVSERLKNRTRPLRLGAGDIGNWVPTPNRPKRRNPVRNFVGRMDEMTIWNVALDADEVEEIYENHKP